MQQRFHKFAEWCSDATGSPWAFIAAVTALVLWAFSRPMFPSLDTWQLVINTGTTIVTFLMVFLIQNTQNRDAKAMHLKLDELIHKTRGARNELVNLEDFSDEELKKLRKEFQRVCSGRDAVGVDDDDSLVDGASSGGIQETAGEKGSRN